MLFQLKSMVLYTLCRLRLLTPRQIPKIKEAVDLSMCDMSVENLFYTTNNVRFLSVGENSGYFRECRPHAAKSDYIQALLDDYYCGKSEYDETDKQSIKECLSDRKNFKKFWAMGVTNDRNSLVSQYYRTGDASLIGLPNSEDEAYNERLKYFVQFVWGELYAYKLNGGIKIGDYQIYNACRCMATERMATLLGMPEMVPHTQFARIVDKEGKMYQFGTLMEPAPGVIVNGKSVEARKHMRTPELQHWLNNLNILDAICYERDHRPCNYTVVLDENRKATAVCAFDNDSPMSFFITNQPIFTTYKGCSSIITPNGYINRPFMDKTIAENILNADIREISDEMQMFLSALQRKALIARIKAVQRAIRNTMSCNPHFLIGNDDWNEQTMEMELSNQYGKTYLCLFGEEFHLLKHDWLKIPQSR